MPCGHSVPATQLHCRKGRGHRPRACGSVSCSQTSPHPEETSRSHRASVHRIPPKPPRAAFLRPLPEAGCSKAMGTAGVTQDRWTGQQTEHGAGQQSGQAGKPAGRIDGQSVRGRQAGRQSSANTLAGSSRWDESVIPADFETAYGDG